MGGIQIIFCFLISIPFPLIYAYSIHVDYGNGTVNELPVFTPMTFKHASGIHFGDNKPRYKILAYAPLIKDYQMTWGIGK